MIEGKPQGFARLPPHNEQAEKTLLGSILYDGDVLVDVLPLVRAEDFYSTAHEKIFEACQSLFHEGKRVDAVLIREELARRGHLEKIGGETYLAQLVAEVPSAAQAEEYARIVSEKSVARNLIHTCTSIQNEAFGGGKTGDKLLDYAENEIFSVGRGAADAATRSMTTVLREAFADIERLRGQGGQITGLPTPFYDLDRLTAGFQPGDLIIVAGRPSMGKTAMTNCVVDHVGVVERKPVLFFSLEVASEHLVRNMLCMRAKVELQKVRTGVQSQEEHDALTRAAGDLVEAPIYIDDSPNTDILQIRSKARRMHKREGLGLVVVDYLQLMDTPREESRQLEIAKVSRGLKSMARELGVPVIAVAQLNRSVDARENKRPRMSDLRESGALEQDADVILLLYREAAYKETEENMYDAEVIVAKQRNGPTGEVHLRFFGRYLRFESAADYDF